ncbi:MAG: hypothetical protein QXS91_00405 [Candidatus Anstonellales archaeon]
MSLNKIMQNKQLKEELENIGGQSIFKILRLLEKTGDDERIAQYLKVKVSDVRAVLNKLNQAGILDYKKTKDKETGWYYYSWVFSPERVINWFNKKISTRIAYLQNLLIEGEYYYCKKCSIDNPIKFELAMDYNFLCPLHKTRLELIDESVIDKYRKALSSGLANKSKNKNKVEKAKIDGVKKRMKKLKQAKVNKDKINKNKKWNKKNARRKKGNILKRR